MPLEPHPTDPNKLIMRAGNYNLRKLVAHTVIAGALFDFMGWLTTRKERITLSAADDAAPAVDAIRDFAIKRGLSLDDAQVREWIDALAQPVQEPVAYDYHTKYDRGCYKCLSQFCPGNCIYTAPLPVQRQPLTVEEIEAIGDRVANEQLVGPVSNFRVRFAQAIEQTLKEKNHG